MTVRGTTWLLFALGSAALVGCSRGEEAPPAVPAPATKKSEEPKPVPPPPKPEPKPDAPIKIAVPEKPAVEPWVVGKSPEPLEFTEVTLTNLTPYSVTGLAVRPEIGRAVVTNKMVDKKGTVLGTRVSRCDTKTGKVIGEWQLGGEYAVLDLSPDGRMVLATQPGFGRSRDTLRLWLIGSDGELKRWSWNPHDVPQNDHPITPGGRILSQGESLEIRWAAFVGNDRVVSMSRGGQLRVFNPDGLQLLSSIDATPCRPAITPDDTRVAFLAGETVALLDPVSGQVTGSRDIGLPPPYPVLAFSPDGTRLAIGGNGKAVFMEMADGAVKHLSLPRLRVTDTGSLDKSFGWAGVHHLYSDQQLHDPAFPIPVWDYAGAEQGQFRGYQLWLSVRGPGFTSTIRPFVLPHLDGQQLISTAKATPAMFTLRPGSGIRIDVSGVQLNKQEEVKADLAARLREIGYVPDGTAAATLFAFVDRTGSKQAVSYTQNGLVTYTRRPARLQLVVNGRELWSESWAVSPPFYLRIPAGKTLDQYLDSQGVGEPNFDLFKKAPIPAYFPGPTAPQGSLGASEFTANGVRDAKK